MDLHNLKNWEEPVDAVHLHERASVYQHHLQDPLKCTKGIQAYSSRDQHALISYCLNNIYNFDGISLRSWFNSCDIRENEATPGDPSAPWRAGARTGRHRQIRVPRERLWLHRVPGLVAKKYWIIINKNPKKVPKKLDLSLIILKYRFYAVLAFGGCHVW
jgi:hypothetical protein